MLCSKCSKTVRPIIAVDIDGTLGDYHAHFHRFFLQYMQHAGDDGPDISSYDGNDSLASWYDFNWYLKHDQYRQIKLSYRQGGMKRSMPLFEDMLYLINYIKVLQNIGDAEVWVTTTRPYLRLDGIDPDTRFWLEKVAQLKYSGLLYDEDKYRVLAENVDPVRVVAVIDDLPLQYQAARQQFGDAAIMVRRPHNKSSIFEQTEPAMITNVIAERMPEWATTNH